MTITCTCQANHLRKERMYSALLSEVLDGLITPGPRDSLSAGHIAYAAMGEAIGTPERYRGCRLFDGVDLKRNERGSNNIIMQSGNLWQQHLWLKDQSFSRLGVNNA